MIHRGNLFDQLPVERLCVRFYLVHDMTSFVQSATRQHNIDPVLGIIGGKLDKEKLPRNEDIIKACMSVETKLKSKVIPPSWNVMKANVSSSVMDI